MNEPTGELSAPTADGEAAPSGAPHPPGPVPEPSEPFDLSGVGRHALWSNLPTLISLSANVFILSFSVRKLGASEYGAVVTIGAATGVLTLFSGALRYAVTRSGARFEQAIGQGSSVDAEHQAAVRAAHALFVLAALAITAVAVGLGWLVPVDLGLHGRVALEAYVGTIGFVLSTSLLLALSACSGLLVAREQFGRISQLSMAGFAVQVGLTLALAGPWRILGLMTAALGSSVVQAVGLYVLGRRQFPWFTLLPERPRRSVLGPVLRYAGGLVILSATGTLSTSSDAFVIGAVKGGTAVTVFRIGSLASVTIAGLLYSSFGVLFPRLARTDDPAQQEEAIAWLGNVVGWLTGAVYGCLCVAASGVVRILLGHPSQRATEIVWITAAALMIDVSYHGAVQVIFARAQQGILAKYSWIELTFNLGATVLFVELYGPVGSALALAGTIVVTDLVGFPIIMRGRWGSPPGRFVLLHGVLQSLCSAALAIGLATLGLAVWKGLALQLALSALAGIVVLALGYLLIGAPSRRRLALLARPSPGR